MRKSLCYFVLLTASFSAFGQADAKPEILVLGTYHMANPGHDMYNMKADDVLAPKRQAEIADLIKLLEKFHPTKIAIESDVYGKQRPQQYADYVAGKYTLTQNEIDQIGFRLAKDLGHAKVYPVDEDGDFPIQRVIDYAKAIGRSKDYDALGEKIGEMVKAQDEFLHSHTVLETLLYMNDDSKASSGVGMYFSWVPYGQPGDYAGPDLLASWYQRNIRIYSNIVKLIDSPNEKILVIYGAGHLGWLQQDAANDPGVRLRKLAEFTDKH